MGYISALTYCLLLIITQHGSCNILVITVNEPVGRLNVQGKKFKSKNATIYMR